MKFDSQGRYYPTLYVNEFWLFREHLYPINETTPELPLHLEYNTLSLWKWQMMVQMQQSFKMQEEWGSSTENEKDEIKVSTNIIFTHLCKPNFGFSSEDVARNKPLASGPHFCCLYPPLYFRFLGFQKRYRSRFQNGSIDMCSLHFWCPDVAFWKNKKNLEGLSVRTIFVNCFMQLVILLYLFDNDTSWIILISASVGLVIEAWKITKAVDVILARLRLG